jgi:hypothetical protein
MDEPIDTYEAELAPDPVAWLEHHEQERSRLVEEHHVELGDELPNLELHAMMHATVETQLALGQPPGVARTLARLQSAGVLRHDAIHAIAAELAELMRELSLGTAPAGDPNEYFERLLEGVDPREWGGR